MDNPILTPLSSANKPTREMYSIWYRKNGLLFYNHLKNPRILEYNQLVLPYNSLYHYQDFENVDNVGPSQNEILIKNSTDKCYIYCIEQYPENTKGIYIQRQMNTNSLIKEYIQNNTSYFRGLKPVSEIANTKYLPIYTYGLLDNRHIWKKKPLNSYYHWVAYYSTIFHNAFKIAKTSNRQQFIEIDVPKRFPTLAILKKGEIGITRSNFHFFNHPDLFLILTLWNLIAKNGNDLVFKDYTLSDDFAKINVIWRIDNKCVIMNLGILMGFISKDSTIKPFELQKRLLYFFIKLMSVGGIDATVNNKEIDSQTVNQLTDEATNEVDEEEENETPHNTESEQDDEETIEEASDEPLDDLPTASNSAKEQTIQQLRKKVDRYNTKLNDDEENLDKDVDETDTIQETNEEEDKSLDAVIDQALDVIAEQEEISVYEEYEAKEITGTSVVEEDTKQLVKAGIMSVQARDRYIKLSEKAYELKSPIDPTKTIKETSVVTQEELQIPEVNKLPVKSLDILDESMLSNSTKVFQEYYVENVLQKDIQRAVMSIQRGGLVVKNYDTELVETINDKYVIHKVQIETLKGHTSTLTFKVPVLKPDGTFKANSSTRLLRRQRGQLPIAKVASDSVALTSYYSKMFVNRTERKQFNLEEFVKSHIVNSAMEKRNNISEVKFGNYFNNLKSLPRQYTILSKYFSSFKVGNNTLHFDYDNITTNFKDVTKVTNRIPLATNEKGYVILYIDKNNNVIDIKDNFHGTLFEFVGLDKSDLPLEYAEVNIFSRKIPLVAILGYHLGFGNLLKTLKLKARREPRGKRLVLKPSEYMIKFSDEVLVLDRDVNPKANLIINGLQRFKSLLNITSIYELDKKSIYVDFFEELKVSVKLLRETKEMFNLWVDPITESILKEMKEPTDLVMLFFRAAELLLTDEHPDSGDTLFMRDKGNERIVGFIYQEMVKAIKEYNARPVYSTVKLTMNPEAVWFAIISDQSCSLVEDSNPIHNLKEKEEVIFSGAGGRSGQTLTAADRKFHNSSIGVTAEGTKDSGDAGAVVYTSADPSYTSLYGLSRKTEAKGITGTKLLTTANNLAVGATINDAKRTSFTNVQHSQTTFCEGYKPMPFRTGYEKVVHTRTGDLWSKVAKKNGTVIDLTKDTMLVQYEDGTKEGFKIGRQIGTWSAYRIPYDLQANVEKGAKFKAGDTLYYNTNYFVKDKADNDNLMLKNFTLARVAVVENFDVYEDSAAVSKKFSEQLNSKLVHIRNIRITTENTVKNLLPVGTQVNADSILCTIHSAQLDTGFFSEDSLKSLESLAALNPKAGNKGIIEKINVIYTADLEDMSEEIRELVEEYDAKLYRESKKVNANLKNGRVEPGFMIDGIGLTNNEIVIQVYITEVSDMSAADKLVIGNQLKCTVARYWNEDQLSEDGKEIDVLFGAASIDNRIVLDAELIGTTNTILVALTEEFIRAYDK